MNDECKMMNEMRDASCGEDSYPQRAGPSSFVIRHPSLRPAGMTLFEVLLALAIFAVAAVSLVTAINQIGHAVLESRQYRNVEQGIESIIDEYSKAPVLDEVEKQIKPGKDGVAYNIKVTAIRDAKNQQGRFLQGLFRIHVTASWLENNEKMELDAETIRFIGLFQPTG